MTNLRRLRTATHRRPRAAAARVALPADSRQPIADTLSVDSRRSSGPRRGISLLEVLISMFVLLFGLMGVAAIFPVGNHYAGRGEQFDRGSALAGAAFADLKARGMLRPELWYYANRPNADDQLGVTPAPVMRPTPASDFNVPTSSTNGPGYAFVIDPMSTALGVYAPTTPITTNLDYFPYVHLIDVSTPDGALNTLMPPSWNPSGSKPGLFGNKWPLRRISLPVPDPANPTGPPILMNPRVAETIFRLRDDVTNELPKENDRPGIQRWAAVDNNTTPTPNYPADDTLLARQYAGNYSWLATVVPTSTDSLAALQPINARFGSDLYEVSVAVFNKRETAPPSAATERLIEAQMLQGNELVIYGTNSDPDLAAENVNNAVEGIRPGNWIAVAGVHPTSGAFLMKWYRILSIDDETDVVTGPNPLRRLMLDGPDWPLTLNSGLRSADNLRAILLPGVISVSTQMLPMESAQ